MGYQAIFAPYLAPKEKNLSMSCSLSVWTLHWNIVPGPGLSLSSFQTIIYHKDDLVRQRRLLFWSSNVYSRMDGRNTHWNSNVFKFTSVSVTLLRFTCLQQKSLHNVFPYCLSFLAIEKVKDQNGKGDKYANNSVNLVSLCQYLCPDVKRGWCVTVQ